MTETVGADPLETLAAAKRAALDAARPEAIAKQHKRGAMSARERIAYLVDADLFLEYGMLAGPVSEADVAPADTVVSGTARLGGKPVAIVSCDYTAMGGSVGVRGHSKLTRFFTLVGKLGCPLIILSEGGGTRIQEMQHLFSAPDLLALAKLSGRVPMAAAVMGRAFAFHANIVGVCDFTVMTEQAALGISGPPMVLAALGGTLTPEEIGGHAVHASGGTVDLVVQTDQQALDAIAKYLGFFMDKKPAYEIGDELVPALRKAIPDSPRRGYDVRKVIDGLADPGSVMELRHDYAKNGVTSLIRLGGLTVGVVANQCTHLGGALDAIVCDKFARFVTLCDYNGVPLIFLVDTPGFMVGPEHEAEGLVRRSWRVVTAMIYAKVPVATVLLRRGYGAGFWAMGGDSFEPVIYLVWPTGEFGGMGLKGAGDIMQAKDGGGDARDFEAAHRKVGGALNIVRRGQMDDVIDPAETRAVVMRALHGAVDSPGFQVAKEFRGPIPPW